jgi:glycosyltransferase involved in cell wall biosynthesis
MAPGLRVLSVGSLPPAWGGPAYGGVATLHATLLKGFLEPDCPVEVIGVISPVPVERDCPSPVTVFSRPAEELVAPFYERLLKELEPDAVVMHHFAHTIGVTHARMSAPPPAIGVAHSWHSITFRSGEERGRAWDTAAEALDGLRAVVGTSNHCLTEGEELGLRYPPMVETIYHPLQPLYSAAGLDRDLVGDGRRGIVYLGSLIPRKDPETLVKAAAQLPDVDLVFAGHGELEDGLRAQIGSLSLADRVGIRHLDDSGVREMLLRSEAMCLPSRSETFGLAYTEALACGTPVVGFAPTLREIRREVGIDVGEGVEAGDPEQVAAAIERVLATEWDRAELRRRTLAAFDLPAATERYAKLIARVVAENAPSGAAARPGPARSTPESSYSPICILGMSRTGTSLTARVLNLAGVHLGSEEELLVGELHHLAGEGDAVLARAREANPEGFWEHYRMMRLNERILRRLGGSWRDPPPLPLGWEAAGELEAEREEARALLDASFAGHDLWGWKDPRNSLTLPFWQQLLPKMRYVICLRNPVDVAASLQRRDGMPLEDGIALWLTYVAAALVNTSGRPRLFVPYESYFEHAGGAAARLARFAGREGALEGPEAERLLAEVIDDRLWRNRSSSREVVRDPRVPPKAAFFHLLTEALASSSAGVAGIRGNDDHDLQEAVDRYAARLLVGARS